MTKKEKELLSKDLCGRTPYGTMVNFTLGDISFNERVSSVNVDENNVHVYAKYGFLKFPLEGDPEVELSQVKPYLRPMSSMTYEEMQDAREKFFDGSDHYDIDDTGEIYADTYQPYTSIYTLSFARLSGYIDWLNAHHFDYRGLIEKGLAIKAPEGMYKTE